MDHTFKLPPRLAAIAALVPDGARLADVGTDHALLPIRLLLDGKIQSAVATDIRPGPLSRAKENAYAAGVQDLSCVLCDGLTDVSPDSVDTVVIAGMGGENIAAILRAGAPEALSAGELYCGKYSLVSNDTLFSDVLAEQDKRLDIAVRGLERSGRESDRERLNALRLAAADITEMRKKYHGDGS